MELTDKQRKAVYYISLLEANSMLMVKWIDELEEIPEIKHYWKQDVKMKCNSFKKAIMPVIEKFYRDIQKSDQKQDKNKINLEAIRNLQEKDHFTLQDAYEAAIEGFNEMLVQDLTIGGMKVK